MQDQLKNQWSSLCAKYEAPESLINKTFNHLVEAYYSKKRYYHNLTHINELLKSAEECRSLVMDYDAVCFSIWFHDIVYNATSSDNEEQSAMKARAYMKELNTPELLIIKVENMILATKNHMSFSDLTDKDILLFLDFDLKILGQERNIYQEYMEHIRKEYSIVPDFLYKPGRKKVLKKFLEADTLYKTEVFQKLFEAKARENIQYEIEQL